MDKSEPNRLDKQKNMSLQLDDLLDGGRQELIGGLREDENESKTRQISQWLEAIGIDDDDEVDKREATARWLARRVERVDDLVMTAQARQRLYEIENAPIPERGQKLLLRVRWLSQQKAAHSLQWRWFANHTLAATLARENRRGVSAESEADILVHALTQVRERLTGGIGELLLAARARLDDDRSKATPGYYKTRGALADLLSAAERREDRLLRAFLYDEILREMRGLVRTDGSAAMNREWLEIVETDANNLASTLDDLGEAGGFQAQKLSVVAAVAKSGEKKSPRDASAAIWRAFGMTPQNPLAASLPGDMANVPPVWRDLALDNALGGMLADGATPEREGNALVACLCALAAAMRAAQGAPDEDVASACFNAGVNLLKAHQAGAAMDSQAVARVILNAAGLAWVLRGKSAAEAIHTALHEENGLDCAVNLLGALVELPGRDADDRRHLAVFAAALWRYRDGPQSGEFIRIAASLEKFKLPQPDAAVEPPPPLQAALDDLLGGLAGVRSPDWDKLLSPEGGDAATLARLGAAALKTALGGNYAVYANRMTFALDHLANLAQDPAALLQQYPATAPEWAAQAAAGLDAARKQRRPLSDVLRQVADGLLD